MYAYQREKVVLMPSQRALAHVKFKWLHSGFGSYWGPFLMRITHYPNKCLLCLHNVNDIIHDQYYSYLLFVSDIKNSGCMYWDSQFWEIIFKLDLKDTKAAHKIIEVERNEILSCFTAFNSILWSCGLLLKKSNLYYAFLYYRSFKIWEELPCFL